MLVGLMDGFGAKGDCVRGCTRSAPATICLAIWQRVSLRRRCAVKNDDRAVSTNGVVLIKSTHLRDGSIDQARMEILEDQMGMLIAISCLLACCGTVCSKIVIIVRIFVSTIFLTTFDYVCRKYQQYLYL